MLVCAAGRRAASAACARAGRAARNRRVRSAGRGGTGDDGELGGVPDGDGAGLVGDGEEAHGGQRVLQVLRLVRRRDVCPPCPDASGSL